MFIKEYSDVFIITLKSKEAGLHCMDQERMGEEKCVGYFISTSNELACVVVNL